MIFEDPNCPTWFYTLLFIFQNSKRAEMWLTLTFHSCILLIAMFGCNFTNPIQMGKRLLHVDQVQLFLSEKKETIKRV